MSDVLVDLLPEMVGAGVVPLYPIIVLLLLQSQGGLSKATAVQSAVSKLKSISSSSSINHGPST